MFIFAGKHITRHGIMNKLQTIENHFVEKIVLTLQDLSEYFNVSVRTIQRIISPLDTIKSYDHNGRYFSLEKLAHFDSVGIWKYQDIHFSKYGTLKSTLVAIINNSSEGMDASQIKEALDLDTRSFCFSIRMSVVLDVKKVGKHYVYFSADQKRFSQQLTNRKQALESSARAPLEGTAAICVLVETIKYPDFSFEQLSQHLSKQGIKIKPEVMRDFFIFYGIEKKNSGFQVVELLQELTYDAVKSLNLTDKFAFTPVLYFKTNKEVCPHCHTRLKVYRTDRRKIYLLDIGQCEAHRTFMHCHDCDRVFESEDFEKRVPPCANVGYDVLVFTGQMILCEHRTIKEAVLELKKRNVHISPSQVAYLAGKFIVYLSILHLQSASRIKQHITDNGGYILHVDGTCDGDSPHLISAIDEVSHFVLANVKVPSESKDRLIPFLEGIKEQYAIPLAVSSDMGRGLLNSIAEVFPGVPHFICHFHFLRDIGKDLLEKEYALIRKKLKSYKISAKLRYRIGYEFGDKPQNIHVDQINQVLQSMAPINTHDNAAIKKLCYVLLLWALDGKKHGDGLGFPFDRPHAEFYRRLYLLWEQLDRLQRKCIENKPLYKCVTRIIDDLTPLINDMQCLTAYRELTKKQSVFDNLRQALSITLPNTTIGLNDEGQDIDMGTIENRVMLFKDNLIKARGYHKSIAYQKIDQAD